ncbi:Mitochondrial acidic protein mam33 [Blastocladiella emersonii ATCC 22665]|nr:Mitochondrial acidic protein mam33 [Blastocladiella emersonii ATCC 22665]
MLSRAVLRTASSAVRAAVPRAAAVARPTMVQAAARTFAVSSVRRNAIGDADLVKILAQELSYEQENAETAVPTFLANFNAKKTFTILDRPGENEVVLSREFANEKITLTFSIDDVANVEPIEGSEEVAFPVSVVITVAKKAAADAGAVSFQAIADGGAFQITNVTYNDDSVLATLDSAEADYKRRGTYVGPIFDELDDQLSEAFYAYLDARGVNAELAEFIPAYVEYKEQAEYVRWLSKVKAFVDRK